MKRIDRDPKRYEYIEQEDYCCVGATLEMILRRHGIRDFDQCMIACELGLLVPEDCEDCPDCAIRVPREYVTDTPDYTHEYLGFLLGTQVNRIAGGINTFFLRHNLPFMEIYVAASEIKSPEHLKKILKVYDRDDTDVIVCCQVVYERQKYGHVCAVDEVKEDSLVLVDTDGDGWKLLEFSYEELYDAIQRHGDKNGGGLWIIRKLSWVE